MSARTIEEAIQLCLATYEDDLFRVLHKKNSEMPHNTSISPMERLIGAALLSWVNAYNVHALITGGAQRDEFSIDANLHLKVVRKAPRKCPIQVWHQLHIGKYCADFVVFFSSSLRGPQWMAVECDGFDFHDRTKEQAAHDRARDRLFQSQDVAILRFTGSEIWRHPQSIVTEVVQFATRGPSNG